MFFKFFSAQKRLNRKKKLQPLYLYWNYEFIHIVEEFISVVGGLKKKVEIVVQVTVLEMFFEVCPFKNIIVSSSLP